MEKKRFGGGGIRLFILTQVFTTFFFLATGFSAIEIKVTVDLPIYEGDIENGVGSVLQI